MEMDIVLRGRSSLMGINRGNASLPLKFRVPLTPTWQSAPASNTAEGLCRRKEAQKRKPCGGSSGFRPGRRGGTGRAPGPEYYAAVAASSEAVWAWDRVSLMPARSLLIVPDSSQ